MSSVYALVHPETLEIRYVGITTYPSDFRFRSHLTEVRNGSKRYVHNWIRSLPFLPSMVILEHDPENLKEAESFWISSLLSKGARLTNATAGGDGLFNPTLETRQKLSSWQIGRKMSDDAKRKMREAHAIRRQSGVHGPRYGQTVSEETREKLRKANLGKTYSLEQRNRLSEALKGRRWTVSLEGRKNMSEAAKGKTSWNKGLHTGNQYTKREPLHGYSFNSY